MVAGVRRMIICWAMGVTQHLNAMDTINEMTNLALLGGHIGRDGAGLSPIRGHSNVQGDRTMGIFDRPEPDLLDALEAEFGVAMPRPAGLDTVDDGASGAQFVTVEDSMGMVHASSGVLEPPSSSPELAWLVPSRCRSEATNICELATAISGRDHRVSWGAMRINNDIVRDHIARVIPGFNDFNTRVRKPGGFALPHPPRDERRFPTGDGKAHFSVTSVASNTLPGGQLMLQTPRSHDQYNTTIYGHDDRYRGIKGDRHVIMVNPTDIAQLGFADGDTVDIVSVLPGPSRRARSYRIVAYPTPPGSATAYYSEANVLLRLDHHGTDADPCSKRDSDPPRTAGVLTPVSDDGQ